MHFSNNMYLGQAVGECMSFNPQIVGRIPKLNFVFIQYII